MYYWLEMVSIWPFKDDCPKKEIDFCNEKEFIYLFVWYGYVKDGIKARVKALKPNWAQHEGRKHEY